MIVFIWILSLYAAFYLGSRLGDITRELKAIQRLLAEKTSKPKPVEVPKSTLIDPDDPVQTAQFEHEQLMKRLNPDE
jgi:hypothetical protein